MKLNIDVTSDNVKIWRVVFEILQAVLDYFKKAHADESQLDNFPGARELATKKETFSNGVSVVITMDPEAF